MVGLARHCLEAGGSATESGGQAASELIGPSAVAGLAGAAEAVQEVAQAVDLPINGVGGVMTGEDAAEFILAGATCVSVGMANFVDPTASLRIAGELEQWAESQGVSDINELVGAFEC